MCVYCIESSIFQVYTSEMIIRKAYKFRLKPSKEQRDLMSHFSGCCRFLWNKCLRLSLNRLESKQSIIWYQEMAFWLKFWKQSDDYGFLKTCHSQVLQQKLKDLDRAFRDGFDKKQSLKRIPRFRKKFVGDSFRFPQGFKIDNRRVYLPKIGWVGFYKSCDIVGAPKNMTISRQGSHWYCSIQVEYEISHTILPKVKRSVGIDLGIAQFAALSNGQVIHPLNAFKRIQERLARLQRKLAKKIKFSENWKKLKRKISSIHARAANMRRDFQHKCSTSISKNHAMVVVEDLKIRNMSRSSKGDVATPGKNVKAKSGLNRSILDQGWGEFQRQLEYKLNWYGGVLVKVDPKYSSQKCSSCGFVSRQNRQDQAHFHCQGCGYKSNADANAAKNILAAGHAVLACGEGGLPSSVKQEPLRNCERVAA